MNKKAFTLIEALVSVAIMAIGFAGVYALMIASNSVLYDAIDREKLNFQAAEVIETIYADLRQIRAYKFSNLDSNNCDSLACEDQQGCAEAQLNKLKNWCRKLRGDIGVGGGQNIHRIKVSDGGDDVYIVSVDFSVRDDKKTVFMKRVFNNAE